MRQVVNGLRKVIMIGLDGATWDLIGPWADEVAEAKPSDVWHCMLSSKLSNI